jgi:hypothetical protein
MSTENSSEKQEDKALSQIAVSGSDFLELLSLVDTMANWINNVGKGDYNSSVTNIHSKTNILRNKYHCH